MAWLSGLAGKAETLLNKIDQNTAAVLNKDKNDQLAEVKWLPPSGRCENPDNVILDPSFNFISYPSVSGVETPVQSSTNVVKDDELVTYLNTAVLTATKSVRSMQNGGNADSILHLTSNEPNLQIEQDSLETSHVRSTNDVSNVDHELALQNEHLELRINGEKYSNELPDVTNKNLEDAPRNSQGYEQYLTRQNFETDKFFTSGNESIVKNQIQTSKKDVENKEGLLDKQEMNYQKEINVLSDKLQTYNIERSQFLKRVSELQSNLDRNRFELISTRSELEQHKARALKTLQEKEKLITELRGNVNAGLDEATAMELNQLRQEREVLREENQQISEQLRLVREELVTADLKLEKIKQKAIEVSKEAHESIAIERKRRIEAEEDARLRTEEVRFLKDELTLQQNSMSLKLRNQESEIARLRTQLSAAVTPSSEVESRLSSLTQTLVSKQQALESLTTERNALRLQLERIENEYRNSRKSLLYNNANDTDDAKAQVPTFFMETPFDTGVTRRVKRAYSSLDAISVRTGVFLRRYPLARILVFIYMVLLQFWVLVVLLFQSPEAH